MPVTTSRPKAITMLEVYEAKLNLAKSADAQEGDIDVEDENAVIDDRE